MGEGVTNVQCQKRWTRNANPEMQNRSDAPWSEAEVSDSIRLWFEFLIISVLCGFSWNSSKSW